MPVLLSRRFVFAYLAIISPRILLLRRAAFAADAERRLRHIFHAIFVTPYVAAIRFITLPYMPLLLLIRHRRYRYAGAC